MRYQPDAPSGVMEFLFIELMLWGKEQGYRWFNLGMAPLSGLENRALSPAWHRLGSLLFQFGETVYGFQGLRQYKEKFDPVWRAKYRATAGGFALPQVLSDVVRLVSG
jgi:phosphatidylglycerol lysyltransferase